MVIVIDSIVIDSISSDNLSNIKTPHELTQILAPGAGFEPARG